MSVNRYAVTCPVCGAEPMARCRTTTGTNRVTDTHLDRIDAAFILRRNDRSASDAESCAQASKGDSRAR